ncbi:MAG TPA: N-acetylmuramoyl-L-alanine amidase [Chloroflexota bacterium]|nr:N-acetylmuramoyl-L-alanine amidase [Chloroflexota bacterium]
MSVILVLTTVLLVRHPTPASGATSLYFPQTGYSIDDPNFANYFQRRGGLSAFGYPVSRKFTFLGFPVQIFQRGVMQLYPDGHVQLLNLLDPSLFPYTHVNGAVFPAVDQAFANSAPAVGTPGYNLKVLNWISTNTPDSWNGMPVAFRRSFFNAVSGSDAFPGRKPDPGLLTGFDIELWGLPTSKPSYDPTNKKFVYQRFQRGILHFDQTHNTTQGILLADYFKSILMGEDLPADLAAAAKASPFYGQYDPLQPQWVGRSAQLKDTNLTLAFEPKPLIVIDPGHGGQEIGTSHVFPDGTTLTEKDLNLTVATKVTALLRAAGFTVIQTRTTDSWVDAKMVDVTGDKKVDLADDLQMRVDIANNAHATLFLSIHLNGNVDPSLRGTTAYYDADRPFANRSQYFATLLNQETVAHLKAVGYNPLNRGVRTDSTAVGEGEHFYLLGPDATRPSQMPGALVEGLFLTNDQDAIELRNPKAVDALAQAYAKAIQDYYAGK